MPSNQNGGELQPLQQTVFERGPQNSFVTPEVQNVYQEGRVYFPSPQVQVESSDVAWYKLGEFAFDTALKTFSNVQDYLIDTKRNGVIEAKDKAESALFDVESAMSVESSMASNQKRAPQAQLMEDLQTETKRIREAYANDLKTVLGDDHDILLAPNLDMNTLGLKYQALALASRNSERDIAKITNKMIWQLDLNSKIGKQADYETNAWMAGAQRTKSNQSAYQLGLAPIPTNNGVPSFGVDVLPNGSFKIKTTVIDNKESPLLLQHPGEEGYFVNLAALDAADWDDLTGLVVADQKGSYLGSPAANQFTESTESILANVANSQGSTMSNGLAAYAGAVLAQYPDTVAERMIGNLPGLGDDVTTKEGARMKLMILRDAAKNRTPIEQVSSVTGMSNKSLGAAVDGLRKLSASENGLVYGDTRDTTKRDELNLEADAIMQVIKGINPEDPILKESFVFKADATNSGFVTEKPNNGIVLAHVLQKNPGLMPIVARVIATANDNRSVYTKADGTIDPAKRTALIGKLMHEQVNSSGYVNLGSQADGVPVYVYNPGLAPYQEGVSEFVRDTQKTVGWPQALKDNFIGDPNKRQQIASQTAWFTTDMGSASAKARIMEMSSDQAYEAARSFVPNTDKDLFIRGWQAAQATQNDPEYGYRSTSMPPMALLYRLALASSPTVQEKSGAFAKFATATPEQREQAMKRVMDDFPMEVDPVTGFMPGISTDMDTSAASLDYIGASNGGIPIAITGIKGKSGIDYMDAVYASSARNNGRIVPKGSDGVPSLMIRSANSDETSGEFKANLSRLSRAYQGILDMSVATNEDMPNGNIANINSETIQNIILGTTAPYMPKKAQQLFGNQLINQPLIDADTAIASLSRNGVALRDVVESDPELSKVSKLMYEVADVNGRGQAKEQNRVLFSENNLRRLYDQAVAHGAKTQADYVGFVLGSMKTFRDNRATLNERDFVAQNAVRANSTQDTATEGIKQGRILWKSNSTRFYDFVTDQVRQGKTIYSGVAPENPEKTAYYVVDAEEAKQHGLVLAIDATMLPELDNTPAGRSQSKRKQINAMRDILFPAKPQDTSPDIMEHLTRQTTLPSEMSKEFEAAFTELAAKNDIADIIDIPFIDLSSYYADNGKMPDDMTKIPQKYILPGHSSTLPWAYRAKSRSERELTAKKAVQAIDKAAAIMDPENYSMDPSVVPDATSPHDNAVLVHGVLKGTTSAINAAANTELGRAFSELAVGLTEIPGAFLAAGKAVLNLDSVLQNTVKDREEAIKQEKIAEQRQRVIDQYNNDPYAWYNKVFGGDALTALRKNPPNKNEVKVPEKFFNFINAVVDFGEPMGPSPFHYLGITPDRQQKLIDTGWSTLETEYQIRLGLSNKADVLADIHETIDNLDSSVFLLSATDRVAFANTLYDAAYDTDKPLTKEEVKILAATPAWRPDLKRAYFNLSLYPDGYVGHTYKTTRESIVDSLRQLLK